MVKLLIVDDEQIERDGMRAILHKGFPDIMVEQAKNGKMAVEITSSFLPDLILMDIKMPGMNGLDAIERISQKYPMIKFIMVTAFDTFEFVRQAIKLGVKDYILKPSRASEIIVTVGKVIKQIEEEKSMLVNNKLQQEVLQKTLALVETDVVTQLLFDHVHEVHVDMLVEMLETPLTDEMFVMLIFLPAGSEHLYSAIKERVRSTKSAWIGALYGCYLPIIVFRDKNVTFRLQATMIAGSILSISKGNGEKNLFIGIGNVCQSLDKVRHSYHESLYASMDTTLPVKFRFYKDLPFLEDANNQVLTEHRKKEFADQIRLGQWEQIRIYVLHVIQSLERQNTDLLQAQQRLLEVLWVITRIMSEIGIETELPLFSYKLMNYKELQKETDRLLQQLIQLSEEHFDHIEADAIHQLKQYIMEHSNEDISLDTLAKKVGLSPIYISKMFKEKQGINYIDFLTECRIEKAKKLMADSEKSIKEITYEVGYHDPNYFSKVFKKLSHVSPKEYRKLLIGNKV